jgi:SOS-response transcriptional repressor LexA
MPDEPRGELTPRQQEIADWIRDYHVEHDRPPTHRDMMAQFGFKSENSTTVYAATLRKKGWIRPNRTRNNAGGLIHVDIVTSIQPNRTTP